ncbi:hypothetical protein [Bradyrhizobium erythrophlei]|jgi:hypothetical protein|uniref:Uncharacterized protein n=1 Tax=Bradyrhizobium erythrophlei TaxID=1437360 RepID=A0A1M5JU84_9BRAD|nr:hypothetical protein [Bradyrhizobium erythrophlei]SHG44127.1 hypothetical protein SAMN05443248_1572 [Bradyrhizobium erythrophlei]
MNGIPERGASSKADRALKLHEQGLTRAQIAERLCVKPDSAKKPVGESEFCGLSVPADIGACAGLASARLAALA